LPLSGIHVPTLKIFTNDIFNDGLVLIGVVPVPKAPAGARLDGRGRTTGRDRRVARASVLSCATMDSTKPKQPASERKRPDKAPIMTLDQIRKAVRSEPQRRPRRSVWRSSPQQGGGR
jgi:hypothetical protein